MWLNAASSVHATVWMLSYNEISFSIVIDVPLLNLNTSQSQDTGKMKTNCKWSSIPNGSLLCLAIAFSITINLAWPKQLELWPESAVSFFLPLYRILGLLYWYIQTFKTPL